MRKRSKGTMACCGCCGCCGVAADLRLASESDLQASRLLVSSESVVDLDVKRRARRRAPARWRARPSSSMVCLVPAIGIDGAAENVAFGVAVDVALRSAGVRRSAAHPEMYRAERLRSLRAGGVRARLAGAWPLRVRRSASISLSSCTASGAEAPAAAVLFVLFGGGPVDQGVGKLLPLFALGALVAYAVAFDFIFRDELVGAVFEDEAPGSSWAELGRASNEEEEQETGQGAGHRA